MSTPPPRNTSFTFRLKDALEELAGIKGSRGRHAVRREELDSVSRVALTAAREVRRVSTAVDDLPDTTTIADLRNLVDSALEEANRLGRQASRAYLLAQQVSSELERRTLEHVTQLHRVQEALRTNMAYVLEEQYVMIVEGQEALVTTREALVASLEATTAQINQEATARATADTALAQETSQLAAQVTAQVSELTAQISTETTARVTADNALAQTATQLTASVASIQTAATGEFVAVLDSLDALFGATNATVNAAGGFGQVGTILVRQDSTPAPSSAGTTNAGAIILIPAHVAQTVSARRIKISVLARKPTSNAASDFSVAYSTNEAGDSGLMSASLTNVWKWHSFFFDVPVLTSGGTDFLGIFGDNSRTGKQTEVARVLIEIAAEAGDLPEIADLSGQLTSLRALDVDTETAFGTMIEQLDVRADGTVAGIDNFGSAMATLHGQAEAAYVLRARAGGQAGELEVVAWENADGGGSAITLAADYIFAKGTLQADLLAVGVAANELINTDLAMGLTHYRARTSGTIGATGSIQLIAAGSAWAGYNTPTITIATDAGVTADGYVRLEFRPQSVDFSYAAGYEADADQFYEFHAGISGNNATVRLRLSWFNTAGNFIGESTVATEVDPPARQSDDPGSWDRYGGIAQAPAGTAYVRPYIELSEVLTGGSARVRVTRPFLGKTVSTAARLSNYGSGRTTLITGDGVATKSLTADHVDVDSLSALSATIGHLKSAETGERLEIQTDKLQIFDANNIDRITLGDLS